VPPALPAHPLDAVQATAAERWLVHTLGLARTRLLCSVLVAVALGLLQRGLLGAGRGGGSPRPVAALQGGAMLLVLALSPLLAFHPVPRTRAAAMAALLFFAAVVLPVFVRVLLHVALGHAREDAQWYDALWRIYAIIGLWMLIAVFIECKVKPVVKARAAMEAARPRDPAAKHGPQAGTSLPSRIHALKTELRDKAIKDIDTKIERAMRQRTTSSRAIGAFDKTVETARDNVRETARLVVKAEKQMAAAEIVAADSKTDKDGDAAVAAASRMKELQDDLNRAKIMQQGAIDHENGLAIQIEAHRLLFEQAEEKLVTLRQERKEAMNLDKYGFYR
jgi:hypothetical protein